MTYALLTAAIFGAVLLMAALPLEWWDRARTVTFTVAFGLFVGLVACCGAP